jgi:hypothetical protein
MNLRMIGLTAVVVCTALLPFAASAGPSFGPVEQPAETAETADPEQTTDAKPGDVRPAGGERSTSLASPLSLSASHLTGIDGSMAADDRSVTGDGALVRTAERCGPEVTSPEGIEAQSCVLTGGRDTWARTYYRNATGHELQAVLSLMGPRGRTVQTHCAVEAEDEPATCETPREPSGGGASQYLAMAEFAAPAKDGNSGDSTPLLLRSGSNSEGPGAR